MDIKIVDRAKDLVKSGGEWISSVDLENTLMGHPAAANALLREAMLQDVRKKAS